ncbi:polycomb group protein EMBRYONIC FLOWER 2-like isoform X4 [Cucurbita moschata]|uniref:Polycomb group protein EMBRYONIC FLOWER 2-like isoform X4 n=1 Tax=Cucurbita moschata TaxID=3662 RepID=A0A6J1E7U6_CUCMO|nr:polycomb group protein EMBRYONIC FLOWER 2-like isoform X4 [Cucurbita moschata]
MPGIPLVARETSCSRNADQMCRVDSRVHLSEEEEIAAEESFSLYCKPVELYNILQRRAIRNPLFLQRCLRYKIETKHKRRIQMAISISRTSSAGGQTQTLFPMYVILGRLVSDISVAEFSGVYRFSRACLLNGINRVECNSQVIANFILPEINKLAVEAKSGSLAILFVSCVGFANTSSGVDSVDGRSYMASVPAIAGYCLWGKIPLESLYISWQNSSNFGLGQRAEIMSTVDMHSCVVKISCLDGEKCVGFQIPYNSDSMHTQQVQVTISAEEFGARGKSPYDSYTFSEIPSSSLSHMIRLRAGNVIFNYRYYNNRLQKTEVTEDFSCPFCLVKCASFKGLRCHLLSLHDLFNFEFWVTEEYQAVNVSTKTDVWRSEIIAYGIDPKQQTFFFCSRPLRSKKVKSAVQSARHTHPFVVESTLSNKADDAQSSKGEKAQISGFLSTTLHSSNDPDCIQSISGHHIAPIMLQFAKTRKLSIERADPRHCTLLRKRQFFHSHRAQPMALEQVLSDRDSEDEVDDDVADLEDRRMLDDFVDVTKDEKQIMHMWNSFVRKQRVSVLKVLADGHIPWACEAFSKLHGPNLVKTPSLLWCWRLLMIKLWNHGLLDANSMNCCNIILERIHNEASDPKS